MKIHGLVTLDVIEKPPDPASGKPYLRLKFSDDTILCITANLAEMIGGAGRGLRERWEDAQRVNRG